MKIYLIGAQVLELFGLCSWISEHIAFDVQMLPNYEFLDCTLLQGRNCVLNAETVFPRIFANFVEVGGYK